MIAPAEPVADRPGDAARLRRQLRAVAEFSQFAAAAEVGMAGMLQAACQAACHGSGITRAKAMVYDPQRDDLTIEAGVGWAPDVIGMHVRADLRSPSGPALRHGQPTIVENLPEDPAFDRVEPLASHGIVSAVNVPIRLGNAPLGVLELDSDAPIALDADDIHFLQSLAGVVATTIERLNVERAARDAAGAAVALAAEREAFSSELEHRVANQLHQVRLALQVEIRRHADDEAREPLARAAAQIDSILRIHRELGQEASGRLLGVRPFLTGLMRDLGRGSGAEIEVTADEVSLPMHVAVTLGRLAHEIAMNAIKHAFGRRQLGRITVGFEAGRDGGPCRLTVADDGAGMGPARAGGRGLKLIDALAAQLGATVRRDRTPGSGGTRYRIEFDCPAPVVSGQS